jgi:hypothetical protein
MRQKGIALLALAAPVVAMVERIAGCKVPGS